MPLTSLRRPGLAVLAGLTLGGCAVSSTPAWDLAPRPVGDLPARFVPDEGGSVTGGDDPFCLVRLRDPESGARLRLVRSAVRDGRALGDYVVDPGTSYGLGLEELLRLDCGTGRGLGAVGAAG